MKIQIGVLFTWGGKRADKFVAELDEEHNMGLEFVPGRRLSFIRFRESFGDHYVARESAKRLRALLPKPTDGLEWPLYVWSSAATQPLSLEEFQAREIQRLIEENDAFREKEEERRCHEEAVVDRYERDAQESHPLGGR